MALDPRVYLLLCETQPRFRVGKLAVMALLFAVIWALLLNLGLPWLTRKRRKVIIGMSVVLVVLWLARTALRAWLPSLLGPTVYYGLALPATMLQLTMLFSLVAFPVWFPLGLYARQLERKRLRKQLATVESPKNEEPQAPSLSQTVTETPAPSNRKQEEPKASIVAVSRRELVSGAISWAGPALAAGASATGVIWGAQQLILRKVRLAVPNLPASLHGLRIGQVTDIHIAEDLHQLKFLEKGLDLLAAQRPDIVVATGDLCDSERLFPEVLRLISSVPARLGHYGCLGNHELFLGEDFVRSVYDRSHVHLLNQEKVRIGDLTLAGVGYAHAPGSPKFAEQYAPELLDRAALDGSHDGAMVLLAHHPYTFRAARNRKVDVTLSGHTHGAQLGWNDRSVLEGWIEYLRGSFERRHGDRKEYLFVSSGLGHWLPWRLNCPPESVLIELVRA